MEKTVTFVLTEEVEKELDIIAGLKYGTEKSFGRLLAELLEEATKAEIRRFEDRDGHVAPKRAYRLPGDYEIREFENEYAAANSGKKPCLKEIENFVRLKRLPVYVLNETSMNGSPYYTVFEPASGHIFKCAWKYIELEEG